jgi:hypothetical protein
MNRGSRLVAGTLAFVSSLWIGTATADGLPDILGIRLGMPLKDARAQLQAQLAKNTLAERTDIWGTIDRPVVVSFRSSPAQNLPAGVETDDVTVDVTMPPSDQVVWRVSRRHPFADNGIPKATLLASLREKYGKETLTNFAQGKPAANDNQIQSLLWLFDEQGRPASLSTIPGGNPSLVIATCNDFGQDANPALLEGTVTLYKGQNPQRDWCYEHYIAVLAFVSESQLPELYRELDIEVVNSPLAARSALASAKWKKDAADAQHKQDLEKAGQQAKPKL